MKGVLLINLGTPTEPTTPAVRNYLKEFLSDPYVIDINPLARWLLLHLLILPFRSPKSAKAYQKIWTNGGSPLLVNSQNLTEKVREKLGSEYLVELAMRYGNPSLERGLTELKNKGATSITVLPLYPQYSLSATETSIQEVKRLAKQLQIQTPLNFLPAFYADEGYIQSFAAVGKEVLDKSQPDHILFSFHGLPERHIHKTDPSHRYCLKTKNCCERRTPENKNCYRSHCFQTAYGIASTLGLKKSQFSISFQSRLGRTPWIQPYTDHVLPELAKKGAKEVAVFCPSFVADCLETLEEIEIRGRDLFLENGGEELTLIPSLNSQPLWVNAVCNLVRS